MEKLHEGTLKGSSPLARGAHEMSFQPPVGAGLIPARAGSTRCLRARNFPLRAHPRSRGEHNLSNRISPNAEGSSPLARGALFLTPVRCRWVGLIPARAGSTTINPGNPGGFWAHPRSRGEHLEKLVLDDPEWGSSPLARGALLGIGREAAD